MSAIEQVKLTELMQRSSGSPNVGIGLIDGPVRLSHPDLTSDRLHVISTHGAEGCTRSQSIACFHGTFVAGMLSAQRGSKAPALSPHCTLLIRPIFPEADTNEQIPSATPSILAAAILECLEAGARIINLSLGIAQSSLDECTMLHEALNCAARRGALVVAAAGNQGVFGGSVITQHGGVIPVAACDGTGRPMEASNFGNAIGKRGLLAPGTEIISLGANGHPLTLSGTSVAAPFVTGAIALLWSLFPNATAMDIKYALCVGLATQRRVSVVPPLLDAEAAYQTLLTTATRR